MMLISHTYTFARNSYKFPKGFTNAVSNSEVGGLFVGGVHVSLYNKQPNWTLRNAREFGVALFDTLDTTCKARPLNEENLAQLATATANFLASKKAGPDQVSHQFTLVVFSCLLAHDFLSVMVWFTWETIQPCKY